MIYDIIIVGGGAAGMMAAVSAAHPNTTIAVVERNPKVGRKIYITGKGRCNVTNLCTPEEFLQAVKCNPKFLYSAIAQFPPQSTMDFFQSLGIPLKVERGNRVFPQSDLATDIIDGLLMEMRRKNVVIKEDRVTNIAKDDHEIFHITGEHHNYQCRSVILATGGESYPRTGSTGDGYPIATALGHKITPRFPTLIPLEAEEAFCKDMQGLSLNNVRLTVKNKKNKVVFSEQGDMLFTHFGISGPLVLSATTVMRKWESEQYHCSVDLKPALDEEVLDNRLLRELKENPNRDLLNILPNLLPRAMVNVVAEYAKLPFSRKANEVTKEERRRLLETLKALKITIKCPRPIEEAIVTAGGVAVGEINPKTMESKKTDKLYVVGELLDLDAVTGGYNLQIAWATGYLAGISALQVALDRKNPNESTEDIG